MKWSLSATISSVVNQQVVLSSSFLGEKDLMYEKSLETFCDSQHKMYIDKTSCSELTGMLRTYLPEHYFIHFLFIINQAVKGQIISIHTIVEATENFNSNHRLCRPSPKKSARRLIETMLIFGNG